MSLIDPVEYARREGFVPVTEEMVVEALRAAGAPTATCDLVHFIPRDDRGRLRSAYLVSLHLDDLLRRRVVHASGRLPILWELRS